MRIFEDRAQVVEFIAKVVNPIIIVAFVVIYWVVGLIFYHYPTYWTIDLKNVFVKKAITDHGLQLSLSLSLYMSFMGDL